MADSVVGQVRMQFLSVSFLRKYKTLVVEAWLASAVWYKDDADMFVPSQPLGTGGIMFSVCPSVLLYVHCMSTCPSLNL